MKKIGIVSCFWNENYGAILQSIALGKILTDLGFDTKYINYIQKSNTSKIKYIINRVYEICRMTLGYRERLKKTNNFREKYINLTSRIYEYNEIKNHIKDIDIFIVGSDQMWNPRTLGVQNGYYLLKFVDNKSKYSYATSFGVSKLQETFIPIYKEELSKFKAISVREKTGSEIIKKLGLSAQIVIDPTLLLSTDQWDKFYEHKPIIKNKYILCYVMPGDHKTANYIVQHAKTLNKKLNGEYNIVILGDKEYKRFIPNYNLICNAGPEEFLNLLNNASYVITNSFHGTCFSINFKKQFITILNINNPVNSRITDLLSELNLSTRIHYTSNSIGNFDMNKIDYREVDHILLKLREQSVKYITDNIK